MDSIFSTYFRLPERFVDRYETDRANAVDVIIPTFNTNELWHRNLFNYYERIPINRLLISDGGSTDNSLEIARKFPRVKIYDHRDLKTLGFCLKSLMQEVQTEWFIYLHSDVFLPDGWFESMNAQRHKFDWFECRQEHTLLLEHSPYNYSKMERAMSGSQMGRKAAFQKVFDVVEDDYLYRNEDIIFSELVEAGGGKYGRNLETYHYHQIMNKQGDLEPKFKRISLVRKEDKKWEVRTWDMQVRGIIKYLKPRKYLVKEVNIGLYILRSAGALDWGAFRKWVAETNPEWLGHISRNGTVLQRLQEIEGRVMDWIKG